MSPDLTSLHPFLFPILMEPGGDSTVRDSLLPFVTELGATYLQDREAHEIPSDVRVHCAKRYGALLIPARFGGVLKIDQNDPEDGGLITLAQAMLIGEDLAAKRPGAAVTLIATQAFLAAGVSMFGTLEQRHRILPGIIEGTIIGGLALTEENSGSAAFQSVETTYEVRNGVPYITGTKKWCTNGPILDWVIVVGKEKGTNVVSTLLAHKDAAGFERGPAVKKWPIPDSQTGDLYFRKTPAEFLGAPGSGKGNTMSILAWGRIGVATKSNGGMKAGIEEALPYIMGREAHGKSLAEKGANQRKIAWMWAKLLFGQCMTRNAAMMLQNHLPTLFDEKTKGQPIPLHIQGTASIAKLVASTYVREVLMDAIQLQASFSVDRAVPLFAYLHDGIIDGIFEGTQEIQEEGVAKLLVGAFKMNGWA